jgi:hypothetical protein
MLIERKRKKKKQRQKPIEEIKSIKNRETVCVGLGLKK